MMRIAFVLVMALPLDRTWADRYGGPADQERKVIAETVIFWYVSILEMPREMITPDLPHCP